MIWYKGWLETRFRLVFMLGITVFLLFQQHLFQHAGSGRGRQTLLFAIVGFQIPAVTVGFCAMLAGAGIATQPGLQATKGLHGSMLFTLALPVSRLRLLTVRSCIGWLDVIGLVAALCGGMWLVAPLRAMATGTEMVEYAATVLACASVVYCFSVLLGTVLDDQWRVWGTLIAGGLLGWLSSRAALPEFADIFHAMGKGGPMIAHTMPWSAMGFSVGVAAILFFAALQVARAREY